MQSVDLSRVILRRLYSGLILTAMLTDTHTLTHTHDINKSKQDDVSEEIANLFVNKFLFYQSRRHYYRIDTLEDTFTHLEIQADSLVDRLSPAVIHHVRHKSQNELKDLLSRLLDYVHSPGDDLLKKRLAVINNLTWSCEYETVCEGVIHQDIKDEFGNNKKLKTVSCVYQLFAPDLRCIETKYYKGEEIPPPLGSQDFLQSSWFKDNLVSMGVDTNSVKVVSKNVVSFYVNNLNNNTDKNVNKDNKHMIFVQFDSEQTNNKLIFDVILRIFTDESTFQDYYLDISFDLKKESEHKLIIYMYMFPLIMSGKGNYLAWGYKNKMEHNYIFTRIFDGTIELKLNINLPIGEDFYVYILPHNNSYISTLPFIPILELEYGWRRHFYFSNFEDYRGVDVLFHKNENSDCSLIRFNNRMFISDSDYPLTFSDCYTKHTHTHTANGYIGLTS
eukprot:GHVR01005706.1.p1 GENE.GHVR01005706.1~~GHVR01005706.1.p1  ORF type:complete len:446 (+),score=98.00 GHVR01005706.1:2-1339(+)